MALRRILGLLILLICSFHVVMTLLYLAPPNMFQGATQPLVARYMSPLFTQNWHLFSPNPGLTSDELWIRCNAKGTPDKDGQWSQWLDPFQGIREQHYANRMTGTGKLLYVYNGIAKELNEDLQASLASCRKSSLAVTADAKKPVQVDDCKLASTPTKITGTPHYAVARRFAADFCSALAGPERLDKIQFKLMILYPKKYSDRSKPDRWGQVDEINFPEIAYTPNIATLTH